MWMGAQRAVNAQCVAFANAQTFVVATTKFAPSPRAAPDQVRQRTDHGPGCVDSAVPLPLHTENLA